MQKSGKDLLPRALNKACFSKTDFGSKVNNPFQNKKGCKNVKNCKLEPQSHVKSITSLLSKRKVSELSSSGSKNNPSNRKLIRRETLQKKICDAKTSEKQLSTTLQGDEKNRHDKNNGRDAETQKVERRRKRKKRKKNREADEASRLRNRTRNLLQKMKLAQSFIDAYSGEGWNGQSREKIKPENELQGAKKEILKCKLGIRDAVRQLECLSSVGCLENSVIGPDGSVYHEHIFCAKCKLGDAFPDNDIILCDGTCNCAFHQRCLEPPLATENIPPEDQGWLCKFCESKMEILEVTNAHLGTHFPANSKWQGIFEEAAMASDQENASLNPHDEWPSDDSEDDDYDPDSRTGTEDNVSDGASSSSSLFWASEEVEDGFCLRSGIDGGSLMGDLGGVDPDEITFLDTVNSLDSFEIERGRQRRDVDYQKLHDEMFGKDMSENEQLSEDEDEDWGPRRRKRRGSGSGAACTVMVEGCANLMHVEGEKRVLAVSEDKRRLFRIPPNAAEKLRRVFAENELPSRAVREKLSNQLAIPFEKINKWFKNARYAALKIRKAESLKQLHSTAGIAKQSCTTAQTAMADPVASSLDNGSDLVRSVTALHRSKSLRRTHRRKTPKSITNPSNKKRRRKVPDGTSNSGINESSLRSSKSVNLDKPISSFRRKSTSKKKSANSMPSASRGQLYLVEMERICRLKGKLESMKKVLLRTCNVEDPLSEESSLDDVIIYVPVAVVREKV